MNDTTFVSDPSSSNDNAQLGEIDVEEVLEDARGAVVSISLVLERMIENRIKRKAKYIVMTCIEFVLAVGSILWVVGNPHPYGTVLAAAMIAYVIAVAIITTRHAYRLPNHCHTTPEVEEAYKKTNNVMIIDGFLEIGLGRRLGNKHFVSFVWGVFLVAFVNLLAVLAITFNEGETILSIFLAALTLYRITANLCEYSVYTHEANMSLASDAASDPDKQ